MGSVSKTLPQNIGEPADLASGCESPSQVLLVLFMSPAVPGTAQMRQAIRHQARKGCVNDQNIAGFSCSWSSRTKH